MSLILLENKWILEFLYTLIIVAICLAIVFKADRFVRLSSHQGIRYFRNAFLFYGLAFSMRYVLGIFYDFSLNHLGLIRGIFEYSLVMAGFFLLYSLIWKKFEFSKLDKNTSLFNGKVIIFHLIAIIISVADVLFGNYYFMFSSQIMTFFFASIISFFNYRKRKQYKFPKFYFIAMLLGLIVWILNFLTASVFNWNYLFLLDIGLINGIFFLILLYGVIKITKNDSKKA
jgi:hypothetical protein